jgi:hypothetical protein
LDEALRLAVDSHVRAHNGDVFAVSGLCHPVVVDFPQHIDLAPVDGKQGAIFSGLDLDVAKQYTAYDQG